MSAVPVVPEESPVSTGRSNPLHLFEDSLSVIAFSLMTIMPVFAMTMRLLRLPDFPGNAVIVQQLTLWIGMLGGALAARSERLLGISSMELLPKNWRPIVKVFTGMVLAAVSVSLTWASIVFVQSERDAGSYLLPGVPKWTVLAVMPAGFALIAFRAVWHAGGWPQRAIAAIGLFLPYLLGFKIEPGTPFVLSAAMTILFAATILGLPIFAVFGGLALLLFWNASTPAASVPVEMYRLVASPLLPSIPLFTLAGYFMVQGGATKRLLRVFTALFSWIPGGLAIATVAICTIFTFAGSGLTILSLGGPAGPDADQDSLSGEILDRIVDRLRVIGTLVSDQRSRDPLLRLFADTNQQALHRRHYSRARYDLGGCGSRHLQRRF